LIVDGRIIPATAAETHTASNVCWFQTQRVS
jgi:hypothetical protein